VSSWFGYFKRGLSRKPLADRVDKDAPPQSVQRNLDNLRPFLKRHWRKGVVGVVLVLLTTLLAFPQPLINSFLIDHVILAKRLDLLVWVILAMVVVKLLSMAAGPLENYFFTRFEQDVLLDIQGDLLDHTLRLPKSFFDDKDTGYLMSRLSGDVQGLQWFFSSTLVYLVSNLIRFIGGVVVLFWMEWRLALVTLVALPLMAFSIRYFSQKLRVLSYHGMEQQANVEQRLQETISATSLIKTFSTGEREKERVMDELKAARQITMEQTVVSSVANLAISAMPDLARAIVLVVGAVLVIQGSWQLGLMLAFLSYIGYVYGPTYSFASAIFQFQAGMAALQRVSAIYNVVPEEDGQGIPVEKLKGDIEFKNVSFSYDGQEMVLQNVACHIHPGEHVAIVGPSGVGKTTLVSLLLRFYKPTQGEIWLDGRPAAEYEVRSLRQRFGYVSQSPFLLSGTILDNLRYGNPQASPEQVQQAARLAGVHDFIANLPQGYDSPVGERGVNLSEGQKQRFSIARALLKNPDILILDEPTASLDSIVEHSIMQALPAITSGKTVFIVAHRLATVQHADRILVLNEHRLVAIGTHQELLANDPFYRSLVANQEILAAA
jgi:ABC-type multidrug transport system fused ATPase/permease subunit